MILRAIRLSNFGIYAGQHEIVPAVARGERLQPITLIGGLNGRGKTSLLSAVLLALYGERSPARDNRTGYSVYLQSLIHKHASPHEGSWVELDLEVPISGETVKLRVRRSWRVANVRAVERLEIWRNGQTDSYLANTWDSHVEQLVPPGLAPLFFFDGEKIGELADFDETPASVQRAMRSLLGLDVVDTLIVDLGRVIRQNKAEAGTKETREQLEALAEELETIEQQIRATEQELAGVTSFFNRNQNLLEEKQEEYVRLGGSFSDKQAVLGRRLESLNREVDEAKVQLRNLAAGPLPLLLVLPLLRRATEQVKQEEQRRRVEAALPVLKERNARLLEALQSDSDGLRLLDRIDELLRQQEFELREFSAGTRLFNLTSVGVGQLYDFVDHLNREVRDAAKHQLSRFRELESERELLERQLLVEVDKESLDRQLQEIMRLAKQVTSLDQTRTELKKHLEQLRAQREQIGSRIRKVKIGQIEAEDVRRVIRFAERAQEDMKVFRERLVHDKVGKLTRAITDAFKLLTHKGDLIERVEIEPATLRISLLDSSGRQVPKDRLSSGEKQMLAISVLWGLARASGLRLPVIIDTPMGRLDSSHRMNFVARYLPNASHQVIVLSTDTEIVGPYFESLKPHVGASYLLRYDSELQSTHVEEGYFSDWEVARVDYKTG